MAETPREKAQRKRREQQEIGAQRRAAREAERETRSEPEQKPERPGPVRVTDEAVEWLDKVWTQSRACPICRSNSWSAQDHVYQLTPFFSGSMVFRHRHWDMLDHALRLMRHARKPRAPWLGPFGYALLGAGGGAVVAGTPATSAGVIGSTAAGVSLLIGAHFVGVQRTESTDDICEDFLRYLDRWPQAVDEETNAEYVMLREEMRRKIVSRNMKGLPRLFQRNAASSR